MSQSKAIIFPLSPELARINNKLRLGEDFELELEWHIFPEGHFGYTDVTSCLKYVV